VIRPSRAEQVNRPPPSSILNHVAVLGMALTLIAARQPAPHDEPDMLSVSCGKAATAAVKECYGQRRTMT
jgi:hypothetical protein